MVKRLQIIVDCMNQCFTDGRIKAFEKLVSFRRVLDLLRGFLKSMYGMSLVRIAPRRSDMYALKRCEDFAYTTEQGSLLPILPEWHCIVCNDREGVEPVGILDEWGDLMREIRESAAERRKRVLKRELDKDETEPQHDRKKRLRG